MSCEKIVLISLALAAVAVCYIAAAPTYPSPRTVDLQTVVNRTVCPVRVEIDEDPDRIPRRIKLLKCEENTHDWCVAHHIPGRECCEHSNQRHVMECVEVHDKVLVKYPKSGGKVKIYDVSVGCACLVSKPNDASTIPPPT